MTLIFCGMAMQAGISGLLDYFNIIEISAVQQIVAAIIFVITAFLVEKLGLDNDRP